MDYSIHWDLLISECPNPADGTVMVLQNGVSTSSFSFKMFTFTGFVSNIYLHCQVHLCLLESGNCILNNLHDPNQSGFKTAHSTETALLAVSEKLHAARSAKLSTVLIFLDLSAAFDTVNHNTLLSTLKSLGICGTAWKWFASYLKGRSYQVTWRGSTSAPCRLTTGVPQGSVLGPLLFSLYTHSIGEVISSHGFSYHCYADDTQLIFSFPPSDTTASARISACLSDISLWMRAHQLKLNPSKTELLVIPATARNLGVTMDNELSFFPHVANVARSCRFLLYNIRRIRPFLSIQAAQVLVQSLVISRLDYCNSLLAGLPLNAIRPLQMIQNAAARLVFNQPKFSHTTPLLRSLHWLPVAARIRFKTLMLAYKAKNGPAPSYLSDLITSRTAPRCLRSSSTARLVPPSLRLRVMYTIIVESKSVLKVLELPNNPPLLHRVFCIKRELHPERSLSHCEYAGNSTLGYRISEVLGVNTFLTLSVPERPLHSCENQRSTWCSNPTENS
ncbi:hypothetical protein C0J50_20803 [Silurus asotus]|uniref:Reverse transcriptase domain-containing protein n=1 Tax=Silurus asotus TaxID=30991 RepID=A0AAD5AQ06_SILAS|nr:hypothetical protein C0J50_20803 [Silurus asotus]